MTWVDRGELTATFLYATPGAEGLRQAIKYLNGEKVEKTITLDTMKVTKNNAAKIMKEHGLQSATKAENEACLQPTSSIHLTPSGRATRLGPADNNAAHFAHFEIV